MSKSVLVYRPVIVRVCERMRPIKSTKRSQQETTAARPWQRTIPVPLEVVFRPLARGTYNLKRAAIVDSSDEEWNLPKEISGSFVRFEFAPGEGATAVVEDPWRMREDILGDEHDAHLEGTTLVYGRWGNGAEDLLIPEEKLGEGYSFSTARSALDKECMEWLSLIRSAMTTPPPKWERLKKRFPAFKVDLLCRPVTMSIDWRGGRPFGIIQPSGILQALIATLQIDALMGSKYRFCSCEGCPNSFEVMRKDQRYCSEPCKHRQVVRDGRRKAPQSRTVRAKFAQAKEAGRRHGAKKTR